MTTSEMKLFNQLFGKYCSQEIQKGHCVADGCIVCPVNRAYEEIFSQAMGCEPPEYEDVPEAPLTICELRQMNGETVYCLDMNEDVKVVAHKKGFIRIANDKITHDITGLTLYRNRPGQCAKREGCLP